MLTLVTGSPGAHKTAYTVWELLRPVPGSTLEGPNGVEVPRRLVTNVKDVLLDHQYLSPENMAEWHTWAQPGDFICYDEIQHVWRQRAIGTKVPDAVQALETHRHMGVDLVVITQDPRLLDVNIRRLVNRHFHIRRVTGRWVMVYEYDHAGVPGNYKTALSSKLWRCPKAAYGMYTSAQLHTKPTARLPAITWLGVAALGGLAVMGPYAYGRISSSLGGGQKPPVAAAPAPAQLHRPGSNTGAAAVPVVAVGGVAGSPEPAPAPFSAAPAKPLIAGCGSVRDLCECYTAEGERVPVELAACVARLPRGVELVPSAGTRPDVSEETSGHPARSGDGDADVLAFMAGRGR